MLNEGRIHSEADAICDSGMFDFTAMRQRCVLRDAKTCGIRTIRLQQRMQLFQAIVVECRARSIPSTYIFNFSAFTMEPTKFPKQFLHENIGVSISSGFAHAAGPFTFSL